MRFSATLLLCFFQVQSRRMRTRALSLLLDPAQDPSGENVPIFKRLFPDRHTLILSGDTGNGFRSYDMLWSYHAPQQCPVILLETAQLAGTCLG